jgi:ferric-dicitrate binding protein FerR (iron transport regulator)
VTEPEEPEEDSAYEELTKTLNTLMPDAAFIAQLRRVERWARIRRVVLSLALVLALGYAAWSFLLA